MHTVVNLQGLANKTEHGLGQCKVHGIRIRVLAVSKPRGLANKIDRVRNARTRIVQGSWD